jgi:hypothetical protein
MFAIQGNHKAQPKPNMKTKSKYACFCFFLAALAVTLWGCSTDNKPYRTSLPVPADASPADLARPGGMPTIDTNANACIERHGNFNIGFVELDDQGWLWAHSQWAAVKNEIRSEHDATPAKGLTLLVFVHGWENNAAYDNDNVNMFRGVLTNLSLTLTNRTVFGVYVGWRGKSLTIPIIERVSFYHRKDVAERLGHQGAATQIFTELERQQDEWNEPTNSAYPRTELIIVGHSFGGQLVYSAISQILTERLVLMHHDRSLNSFGDLVVLVNPAFEASLYKNLQSLATSPELRPYPPNQRPALAIFTSKGDDATGVAFPVGRFFSTRIEKTRPGGANPKELWMFNVKKDPSQNEKNAIMETVGHDEEFINYELNYVNYNKVPPPNKAPASSSKSSGEEVSEALENDQSVLAANNVAPTPMQLSPYVFNYSTNTLKGTNYYACILQPRTNCYLYKNNYVLTNGVVYKPGNPFLNVIVDPKIIHDHNDINNPIFLTFLRDFILLTEKNFPNKPKQQNDNTNEKQHDSF